MDPYDVAPSAGLHPRRSLSRAGLAAAIVCALALGACEDGSSPESPADLDAATTDLGGDDVDVGDGPDARSDATEVPDATAAATEVTDATEDADATEVTDANEDADATQVTDANEDADTGEGGFDEWAFQVLPTGINRIENAVAVSASEQWLTDGPIALRLRDGEITAFGAPADGRFVGFGPITAVAPDDLWAEVSPSRVARFDGEKWTEVDPGTSFEEAPQVITIVAAKRNEAFLLARLDDVYEIRHFDGNRWHGWPMPTLDSPSITALTLDGDGRPWVAAGAFVARWTGLEWQELPPHSAPFETYKLWISPTGGVHALIPGRLIRYDEEAGWVTLAALENSMGTCSTGGFFLTGTRDDDVYAGFCDVDVVHFDGQEAEALALPKNYTVAADGTVLAWDASRAYLRDGRDLVPRFTVGAQPDCRPVSGVASELLVCDNAVVPARGGLSDVLIEDVTVGFRSATSTWLARVDGALERHPDGGDVVRWEPFLGSTFVAMTGLGDSDVWAVTAGGGSVHWDGATWTTGVVPVSAWSQVQHIEASPVGVWASAGGLFRWIEGAWQPQALPSGVEAVSSFALDDERVWIIGSGDGRGLYSWDGAGWTHWASYDFWDGPFSLASDEDGASLVHMSGVTLFLERLGHAGPSLVTRGKAWIWSGSMWHIHIAPGELLLGGTAGSGPATPVARLHYR